MCMQMPSFCVCLHIVETRCGLDLINKLVEWTVMNQKTVSQNVIQSQHIKSIVKVALWFTSNVVSVTT